MAQTLAAPALPTTNLRAVAVQAATKAGIDPNVFVRQINQESGFNPNAQSGAGAVGIAQIVPKYHPGVNATDPVASLDWAANYMAGLVKQYGSYAPALSVYNSGNPTAYKDPNFAKGQTFNYVKDILGGTSPSPSLPQPILGQPVAPQTPSNPLANPVVQQVLSSNDKLLGITAPTFPTATAPTRTTSGSTGQLTYKIQGHATARTQQAIQDAEDYLGTPYVYGGESTKGFDCSGLLQYVWAKNGVSIPRTTYDQFQTGTPVAKTNLQPGDAVFFTGSDPKNGLPGHVAMYIGGGKVIQAPHTGADVEVTNLSAIPGYQGARRYAA